MENQSNTTQIFLLKLRAQVTKIQVCVPQVSYVNKKGEN